MHASDYLTTSAFDDMTDEKETTDLLLCLLLNQIMYYRKTIDLLLCFLLNQIVHYRKTMNWGVPISFPITLYNLNIDNSAFWSTITLIIIIIFTIEINQPWVNQFFCFVNKIRLIANFLYNYPIFYLSAVIYKKKR